MFTFRLEALLEIKAHFYLNLARETYKKAQCGPRAKIVALPCSMLYLAGLGPKIGTFVDMLSLRLIM
jgi:hypothetical protein